MSNFLFTDNTELFIQSIKDGIDINKIDNIKMMTPLHYACLKGKIEHIKILIESGADLNTPCLLMGFTPLHYSCFYENFEITNLLLEAGCNRSITCKINGYTPLHYVFGLYGEAGAQIFNPPKTSFDNDTNLFRCDFERFPEEKHQLIREGYIPDDDNFYDNVFIKSNSLIDGMLVLCEKLFDNKEFTVSESNGSLYTLEYFDIYCVSDTLPIVEWNILDALIQKYPDKFTFDKKYSVLIEYKKETLIPVDKITPLVLNYLLHKDSPIRMTLV
jgi:hypothetical protein